MLRVVLDAALISVKELQAEYNRENKYPASYSSWRQKLAKYWWTRTAGMWVKVPGRRGLNMFIPRAPPLNQHKRYQTILICEKSALDWTRRTFYSKKKKTPTLALLRFEPRLFTPKPAIPPHGYQDQTAVLFWLLLRRIGGVFQANQVREANQEVLTLYLVGNEMSLLRQMSGCFLGCILPLCVARFYCVF